MNAVSKLADSLFSANEIEAGERLANEFNRAYQKTALNILEMGRIACEAKEVSKVVYALFCEKVFMKSDSMMAKLIKIGKHYPVLFSYKDSLPSQWTTIYNLTCLSNNEFVEKCESNLINPKLTGAESLALIGKSQKNSSNGKAKATGV